MPIVNGHAAECGCYVEGHWGQYGPDHLADQAEGFGWPSDEDHDPRYWRRVADSLEDGGDPVGIPDGYTSADARERHTEAADHIETWLNDHTPALCKNCGIEVIWHDDADEPEGYWVHAPEVLSTCESADPQMFTWHWHDGEFFLSPICENGDCDDDTCAHWD